jgi:tRNA uridine 5-carboxymethylaminomethyl modification enzyme
MINYPSEFDAIVVGGGHAGCEAAWAIAQSGFRALLITLDLDRIAQMSCNPSIGGVAKGHLVREIDALGGIMGRVADAAAIQYRTLNASKGPAVQSTRLQCDTQLYRREMLRRLTHHPNIYLVQAKVEDVILENNQVTGVVVNGDVFYKARCVVLCTGTFLRGLCHIGDYHFEAGRSGDTASVRLSDKLREMGIRLKRLKTGTPPRLLKRTIDYSKLEIQPGDTEITRLSFYENQPLLPQVPCYITYTNEKTHDIIRAARERSPLFNGTIHGIGPRYCPSIEDKVYRFPDKDRHQIFVEPMGLETDEIYPAGISSSLPFDVQIAFVHSIPGFENAHIIRPAYAVEYDAIETGQMMHNMALRDIPSIFLAGQINCTSGYEEAAAQGIMAGINAVRWLKGEDPFVLRRDEAYIGVLVDDLIMRGADEPYRMFTSRAEFRLSLREDNADLRLSKYGHELGLLPDDAYDKCLQKQADIERLTHRLARLHVKNLDKSRISNAERIPEQGNLAQLLKMPQITMDMLVQGNAEIASFSPAVRRNVEISSKFDGYIQRENARIASFVDMESRKIPADFDYTTVSGLTTEVLTKLQKYRPANLAEASRIPGMTPAAINAIWIAIKR